MRDQEFHVLQDVLVLGVEIDGDDVLVDLYGSDENVCGSVRFTFASPAERVRHIAVLRRWASEAVPLMLVEAGSTISLQNDRARWAHELALPAG